MLNLFYEYKNSNHITDALLVGRNLFNKHPGNQEIFTAYFDLLCSLAERLPVLSERKSFWDQANVALAFFVENADLDEQVVSAIHAHQERLDAIDQTIMLEEQENRTAQVEKIHGINDANMEEIYRIKDKLRKAETQADFDYLLADLSSADNKIDKEMLSETQEEHYDSLTKECTEAISAKMQELEYKSNKSYNKMAISAYSRAFQEFKENEGKYKNEDQLFQLVSKTLFAFEASRLFNETLIYYNHIYSYIFNKLDDSGKLAITRFSVDCERKLRK